MKARTRRWMWASALLAGMTLATGLQASAEVSPVPVRETGSANEYLVSAGANGTDTYLGWAQYTRRRPQHVDTYLTINGGSPQRVNRSGTEGFGSGIDGDTMVYQQAGRADSSIVLYDIPTGIRSMPPAGLNNSYWQWHPTFDDPWILYGENKFNRPSSPWRVFLFNVDTLERRLLDSTTNHCRCIYPDQVQGNYAVWDKCVRRCRTYIHDIALNKTQEVPDPGEKEQYVASVTSDGTVYLARSGPRCGQNVRIVRYSLGSSTPAMLYSLPRGTDIADSTFALESAGGTDVYFDRFRCGGRWTDDLFRLPGADAAVALSRARPSPASKSPRSTDRRQASSIPAGALPPSMP